jgi:hypothetical protein
MLLSEQVSVTSGAGARLEPQHGGYVKFFPYPVFRDIYEVYVKKSVQNLNKK